MATFKPIISYKRSDGTYHVQIRIIHNRQKKLIGTNIYVTDKDITRSKKIKNQAVLDQLEDIVKLMRNKCNAFGLALDARSIEEVARIATSENPEDWHLDFIAYCKNHISQLKSNTAKAYTTALNSFVDYLNRSSIDINEITKDILVGWLKNVSVKSSTAYYLKIKTCYMNARKEFNDEDDEIIRIPKNPFSSIKIDYSVPVRKCSVTVETLIQIKAINLNYRYGTMQHNSIALARDLFMLSFYLCGMNLTDMFHAPAPNNGYLIYNRQKTKDRRYDNAEIKLKIQPEAQEIIDRYKDVDGKRFLGFYHRYNSYTSFLRAIDRGMQNLSNYTSKKLIFYSARHTWATLAVNKVGIDKYTVHQALNHVDDKLAITDVYIEKDWSVVDNANRKVIDFILQTEAQNTEN